VVVTTKRHSTAMLDGWDEFRIRRPGIDEVHPSILPQSRLGHGTIWMPQTDSVGRSVMTYPSRRRKRPIVDYPVETFSPTLVIMSARLFVASTRPWSRYVGSARR
jgi:hypothetical protein